jgi:hypothetical protein
LRHGGSGDRYRNSRCGGVAARNHQLTKKGTNTMMLQINMPGFTQEEVSILLEAIYFSLKHRYEDFADHIDLNDETLKPVVQKFLDCMDE